MNIAVDFVEDMKVHIAQRSKSRNVFQVSIDERMNGNDGRKQRER